jgi:hypothetical protein
MKRIINYSGKNRHRRQIVFVLPSIILFWLAAYLLLPASIRQMFEPRVAAATFTVTNTSNSGAGSLRQLILDANANSNADTINFNIPPTDPRHFYYQNNGVAGTVSQSMIAATTAADDATIADIDPDWAHSWYSISTDGTRLTIGTEVTIDGYTQPGAQSNTNATGGLNTVLRVEVTNGSSDGTSNCVDIFTTLSAPHTFRGLIINRCGNSSAKAINFDINNNGSIAAGNFIGTDPSGTIALFNGTGIGVSGSSNISIGGASPADRNLISGNFRGIDLTGNGNGISNVSITGNLIGTARDGVSPLGNGFSPQFPGSPADGISIGAFNSGAAVNNRIENNVIAFNSRSGVFMGGGGVGSTQTVTGNSVSNNSIHSNGSLGIDLNGDSVTANDACDVDTGINNLQNYPVLASATASGGSINITGMLDSNAGGTFRIEFFASPAADPSGFGEGKTFLGATTVTDSDNNCLTNFNVTLPYTASAGTFITSTATDAQGNTSEFSAVTTAAPPTAALVQVSGRVVTAKGRGISRARVELIDASGEVRIAYTNSFGYYRFEEVAAGGTYILTVTSKRFTFAASPFVLFILEDANEINFTAFPVRKSGYETGGIE